MHAPPLCVCWRWRRRSIGAALGAAPNWGNPCLQMRPICIYQPPIMRACCKQRVRGGCAPGGAHQCPQIWGMGGGAAGSQKT